MDFDKINLQSFTRKTVKQYLQNMDGHPTENLYDFVICDIEKGLVLEVLKFTNHNLTKAAGILGITRTTLRNKIKKHKL